MLTYMMNVAVLLALGLSQVAAQEALFDTPMTMWSSQIIPAADTADPGVLKGNGVRLSPDKKHVIVTSVGGTVTSFSASTGSYEWEYNPPPVVGAIIQSHSTVVFTTDNAIMPYMVYSLVETTDFVVSPFRDYTVLQNENSANAVGYVVALDMNGTELWISDPLAGIPAGDPVISDDGVYVYLTHNAELGTVGYFTQLMDGAVFYSGKSSAFPLSPPGIYHSPAEGNYDDPTQEARSNTNDMILFSQAPLPDESPIGLGVLFGFQLPLNFAGNASEVGYFALGEQSNYKSTTAPVISNLGYNAYIGATRSQLWCWANDDITSGAGRFNRGRQGIAEFTRNSPVPGTALYASPAVSSGSQPSIFAGTASPEFVRTDYVCGNILRVPTTSFIMAGAQIDPYERVVYYVEDTGLVHQAGFTDIQDVWTYDLGISVLGEMAVSEHGAVLYVADTRGLVTALQVSNIPVTDAPTMMPTLSPSMSPTAPTAAPTNSTMEPTWSSSAPSVSPTDLVETPAPSAGATPPPTGAPTTGPTVPTSPTTPSPVAPAPTPLPTSAGAAVSAIVAVASLATFLLF